MIEEIYTEDFEKLVLNSDCPVVVDFFASWCGPCKMLAPELEYVQAENADFDFYKINTDECPELAMKYGIMSIPNVVIFKNGDAVDRSVGFINREALQEFIDRNR